MREPVDDSKKLLPLLVVIAVVIMLLGGLFGLVKRRTVPNDAPTNQQVIMERHIKEQRDAPAARPSKLEQRDLVGGEREKDASRRVE
jgi:hypothetical protein